MSNRIPLRDVPTRRQFLGKVGSGCVLAAGVLAGCEVAELKSTGAVVDVFEFDVAELKALQTVGGVAPAQAGVTGLALVRTADDQVIALDRLCSHAGNDLGAGGGSWEADKKVLRCSWHFAAFNPDGSVAEQPAGGGASALTSYPVTFDAATGKGSVDLGSVA
jgi:nitrite reductase/ring-hydroxylating ferredoxin subunit